MYGLKNELNVSFVIIFIICLMFPLMDYFYFNDFDSDDILFLILAGLFMISIIRRIIKYLHLKRKGVCLENIPYDVKVLSNSIIKEWLITVEYYNDNSEKIILRKKIFSLSKEKNFNNKTTKVLIDKNNTKYYYIFVL